MCFGGTDSSATITSNTTAAQDAARRAKNGQTDTGVGPAASPTTTVNDYNQALQQYQGFPLAPPPDASDLTDALLQKTRTNFAMRLMMGKSQSNSFGAQTGGLDLSKNILGGS